MVDPIRAVTASEHGGGHQRAVGRDYRHRRRGGRLVGLGLGLVAAAVMSLVAPVLSADDANVLGDWITVAAILAASCVVLFVPRWRPSAGFQMLTESGRPAFVAVSTPGSVALVLAIAPPLTAHTVLTARAVQSAETEWH